MSSCIACDLAVFTPEQRLRHDADTHALLADVERIIERDDGFVLHFRALPALLDAWMADELRCCPFLAFVVDAEDRTLTIAGPTGAKEILAGYSAFRIRTQGSGVPSGSATSKGASSA